MTMRKGLRNLFAPLPRTVTVHMHEEVTYGQAEPCRPQCYEVPTLFGRVMMWLDR